MGPLGIPTLSLRGHGSTRSWPANQQLLDPRARIICTPQPGWIGVCCRSGARPCGEDACALIQQRYCGRCCRLLEQRAHAPPRRCQDPIPGAAAGRHLALWVLFSLIANTPFQAPDCALVRPIRYTTESEPTCPSTAARFMRSHRSPAQKASAPCMLDCRQISWAPLFRGARISTATICSAALREESSACSTRLGSWDRWSTLGVQRARVSSLASPQIPFGS